MKKFSIIILMFIILSSFALAINFDLGNNDFLSGDSGLFNENLKTSSVITRAATPKIPPFIIDNNGTNYLGVMSSGSLIVYDSDLNIVSSVLISNYDSSREFSNFVVDDLNADNYDEIVFYHNGTTRIYTYNNSLSLVRQFRSDNTFGIPQMNIGCDDNKNCIVFGGDTYSSLAGALGVNSVYQVFNYYINSTPVLFDDYESTGKGHTYFSDIGNFQLVDWSGNGQREIVFITITEEQSATKEYIKFYGFEINSTTLKTLSKATISSDSLSSWAATPNMRKTEKLSAMVCADFDPTFAGIECVFNIKFATESKMIMLKSDLSTYDSYHENYPEFYGFSNPAKLDPTGDSGSTNAVCTLFYGNTSTSNRLRCISKTSSGLLNLFIDNVYYDWARITRINQSFPVSKLIYGVREKTQTNDRIEVSTLDGIYELSSGFTSEFGTRIFTNPLNNSVMCPYDMKKKGLHDYILFSSNRVDYLSDGYINQNAKITDVLINPCINSVWKINTSVQLSLKGNDVEGFPIKVNSYLYYNDINQQNGTELTINSGEWSPTFNFIANKTITQGEIRFSVEDTFTHVKDNKSYYFSTNSNGVILNDCTSTISNINTTTATTTPNNVSITPDINDNIITNNLKVISDASGLGSTIIWLIIMLIVTGFIIWKTNENSNLMFALVFFVNLVLVIIGTFLGFVGVGIVITIVIGMLIMFGIWLKGKMTGDTQGQ